MDIKYLKTKNHQFVRRIGLLSWYEDLEDLGLHPRNVTGMFWNKDLPILFEFCKNNREYHIVSTGRPLGYINRYVPEARRFRLANGDADPTLELIFPQELVDHFDAELIEMLHRLKF